MVLFEYTMFHPEDGTKTVHQVEAEDLLDLHERFLKGTEWRSIEVIEAIED